MPSTKGSPDLPLFSKLANTNQRVHGLRASKAKGFFFPELFLPHGCTSSNDPIFRSLDVNFFPAASNLSYSTACETMNFSYAIREAQKSRVRNIAGCSGSCNNRVSWYFESFRNNLAQSPSGP